MEWIKNLVIFTFLIIMLIMSSISFLFNDLIVTEINYYAHNKLETLWTDDMKYINSNLEFKKLNSDTNLKIHYKKFKNSVDNSESLIILKCYLYILSIFVFILSCFSLKNINFINSFFKFFKYVLNNISFR